MLCWHANQVSSSSLSRLVWPGSVEGLEARTPEPSWLFHQNFRDLGMSAFRPTSKHKAQPEVAKVRMKHKSPLVLRKVLVSEGQLLTGLPKAQLRRANSSLSVCSP